MLLDDILKLLARPDAVTNPAHPLQRSVPQRAFACLELRMRDTKRSLEQLFDFPFDAFGIGARQDTNAPARVWRNDGGYGGG